MTERFSYCVHGMSLQSDLELPELLPLAGGMPDIHVRIGSLDHLSIDWQPWTQYHLAPDRVVLNVADVARFQVTGGKEILVEPNAAADAQTFRLFLFGSAMGCLLHQRGLLPLHANALRYGDEGVMFLGRSGSGKSTLAAALGQRGYELLADDLCAVAVKPGSRPIVYPGMPQIKLWREAADLLGYDTVHRQLLPAEDDKFAIPATGTYCRRPLPIGRIYLLDFHDGEQPEFAELQLLEKLAALKGNTYRKGMVAKMGITARHLEMSGFVAQTTRIRRVLRPRRSLQQLDGLLDAIEEDLA